MKNKPSQNYVPEGWQSTKLAHVFEFKNGLNKEKKFFGQGTPIINYMDVNRGGGLREKNVQGRVEVNQSELTRFGVNRGDVFFTRTSETLEEIGFSAVALDKFTNTVFSGFVLRARPKGNLLIPEYSQYCFRAQSARKEIMEKSSYTTRALISGALLNHVNINLPPVPEQNRIVAVLETWDQAIQKLSQKIEKKKNIKKGLMQELLTGKTRLQNFKEDWIHTSLGEVCKFWNGFPFPSQYFSEESGIRIVRNRDLKGDGQILYYLGKDIPDSYTVHDGDILVGMDGDFMACRWAKGRALLNQRVGKLVAFKNANKDFLFYKIQTPLKIIEQETSSTTVKHLSSKVFEKFKVVLPPKLEQDAIARILVAADKEIEILEYKLKNIQEQKCYLLNNLITGTIRTPETLSTHT